MIPVLTIVPYIASRVSISESSIEIIEEAEEVQEEDVQEENASKEDALTEGIYEETDEQVGVVAVSGMAVVVWATLFIGPFFLVNTIIFIVYKVIMSKEKKTEITRMNAIDLE